MPRPVWLREIVWGPTLIVAPQFNNPFRCDVLVCTIWSAKRSAAVWQLQTYCKRNIKDYTVIYGVLIAIKLMHGTPCFETNCNHSNKSRPFDRLKSGMQLENQCNIKFIWPSNFCMSVEVVNACRNVEILHNVTSNRRLFCNTKFLVVLTTPHKGVLNLILKDGTDCLRGYYNLMIKLICFQRNMTVEV